MANHSTSFEFDVTLEVLGQYESFRSKKAVCLSIVDGIIDAAVEEVTDLAELNSIFSSIYETDENVILQSDPIRLRDEQQLSKIFDSLYSADSPPPPKKAKTLDDIFACILDVPENHESNIKESNFICSSNCPSKKCRDIPLSVIAEIRSTVLNLAPSKLHNYLLQKLSTQLDVGISNHDTEFVIRGYHFCHASFQAYFGISDYLLKTVLKEHQNGYVRFVHGNKGNVYRSIKRDTAVAFILKFSEVHCENLPDRHFLQLPSYLNIRTLYEIYMERVKATDERLGEREFYHIFQQYFGTSKRVDESLPVVVFQSHNTHPKCNTCAKINDLRKRAKNETEAAHVDSRMRAHMLEIRRKYLKFSSRIKLAIRYPEDYLHLIIDDMDQAKLQSPHYCQNTKELSNLLKLKNHLTGVLVHNGMLKDDKYLDVFLNNDQFTQGSNKNITIIHTVLLEIQSQLGRLPRKLLVQSDNCSKDLKNQFVIAFYYLLVEMNIFEEVLISHMPPGHTHNQLDFCFGLIASKLKKVNIPTFEALKEEISNVNIPSSSIKVHELVCTTDFSKFVSDGHLLQMQGHRSFFQFKIRKENELTKLYVKENDLDDKFAFNSGIKLLSNVPNRIQMEISEFRRDTGYSEVFESVFTKYIPTLSSKYSEDQIDQIKSQWEQRIDFLINLKEEAFTPFNFHLLRPQVAPSKCSDLALDSVQSPSRNVALSATFYPMEFSSFSESDLKRDISLVLYTVSKRYRPWIGLMTELSEDKSTVSVQWVKKVKDKYILHENSDSSPYISSVPYESIMFTDVLRNISETGERHGPYVLDGAVRQEIMKAYKDRDESNI